MEKKMTDSQVIVVTSGKGGVGKTTTVANISTGLARLDFKVVVLDLDIGLKKLDLILGLENRVIYDIVQVIEGECSLRQALVKDKRFPSLYMLPAAQSRNKNDITSEQVINICDQLREDFDYIIIDCPAGIEQGFNNSIAAADRALLITNPEVSAVRDADRIIGILESSGFTDIKLIVNRIEPEMVKKGNMLSIEDLLEHLYIELIGIVPEDKNVIISTNNGEPIILNNRTSAGLAFSNIARRITGEDVEFLTMETDSFWTKLKRNLFVSK
ncbi:Septum site-determining protein MinD [Candidatus Syntrophocurvum alkaliphilum]|uniref:Septum site-determining protein MinD n=1 Tax=Candidatus Syntrophocurvum alkaliphilum TaxID=2293317 RepID=A0A6I6DGX6_9FIRM|nr:septum site-determining protein MinD [Candidatus Syntrophocurvum alkaliphilum]QGU00218.1 Septum site-determining protein MinD [Candidatus Syntrophocurvum alkaliphilum]